jgi:hypothetical protein
MLNVIVAGDLNEHRGSIPVGRVFEHTDDAIAARFMPNGQLDTAALTPIPTIFMNEGRDDEIARIGWLNRIERRNKDYQLQYAYDPEIPFLTNAEIYAMAGELQMREFEFSRCHWAVKDVDLFQVLFRHKAAQRPLPRVFQLSANPVRPKLVTVMMPFSRDFSEAYEPVKLALEAEGFECKRADDFWLHAHILHDIIELICTATVVVCDLSGKNPNVFYEAGIAHTLGKEVILIARSMDDVPFDLRALRCITYLNNGEGRTKLAAEVLARVQTVA